MWLLGTLDGEVCIGSDRAFGEKHQAPGSTQTRVEAGRDRVLKARSQGI